MLKNELRYSGPRPQAHRLFKVFRPKQPDGIFDTILSFFEIGFEPFILLLGLAGLAAGAALFIAITAAGRRSFGRTAVKGRNGLEGISEQRVGRVNILNERVERGK